MWWMRTAESVVLTDWPPGPPERITSILQVLGIDLDLDVLDLGHHRDGRRRGVDAPLRLGRGDALHAVHARLVLELRVGAACPLMPATTSLMPPADALDVDRISTAQRWRSAKRVYMRNRSAANSAASSPPVPARISRRMFFSSFGSLGMSSS